MNRYKKGEGTYMAYVIGIIVLIISFIIVLYFIFGLDLGKDPDEICHNSLVVAATSPVPTNINCHTKYFCLTMGDKCNAIPSAKVVKMKNKEDAIKFFADEMARCWSMTGEGNLRYTPKGLTQNFYCGLCSIVYLSPDVKNELKEVSQFEFYGYLAKNNAPKNSMSYLEYLYGEKLAGEMLMKAKNKESILDINLGSSDEWGILTGDLQQGLATPRLSLFPYIKFLPPVLIRPLKESYEKVGCTEFFTQA